MSSTKKPFVLHWGIVGAGRISSEFVKDLVLDPGNRGTTDVSHAVVAVGSRSIEKAKEFIEKWCPEGACAQKKSLTEKKVKVFGSYEEVYTDTVSKWAT